MLQFSYIYLLQSYKNTRHNDKKKKQLYKKTTIIKKKKKKSQECENMVFNISI